MADYNCVSRTNYFRVRDTAAFAAWVQRRGLAIHTSDKHPGHFALAPGDDYYGAFPNRDAESEKEIDFLDELSGHLHQQSVAVILEAGAEKLRYIIGHAAAVDSQGRRIELFLDDIYDFARQAFPEADLTRAEY
jgi:hypothetical protein